MLNRISLQRLQSCSICLLSKQAEYEQTIVYSTDVKERLAIQRSGQVSSLLGDTRDEKHSC